MKTQINIQDVMKDDVPTVEVKNATAKNGMLDDHTSSATRLHHTLILAVQLLNDQNVGQAFGASIAAFQTLADRLRTEAEAGGQLQEELTNED